MQALNTYLEGQGTPSQPARGWSFERRQMVASTTLDPGAAPAKFIAVAVITASGKLAAYNNALSTGAEVCVGLLPYKAVSTAGGLIAIGGGTIDGVTYDTVEFYTSGVFDLAEITGLDAAGVVDLGGHLSPGAAFGSPNVGEVIIPGAG